MPTPCFWIEPAGHYSKRLSAELSCGHSLARELGIIQGDPHEDKLGFDAEPWPERCPECGQPIDWEHTDTWRSLGTTTYYRRPGVDEAQPLREFGPGAMWDAYWMKWLVERSPDGRCIQVRLPGGHDWTIDSESSNCTRKGEDHDCWCRHGEPPNLTVDKNPEPGRSTCQAGGGSIAVPGYHGFLRDGALTDSL